MRPARARLTRRCLGAGSALLGALLALGAALPASPPAALPALEQVLGFRPGTDRRLADWNQVTAYFHALAASSPRVRVEDVGRTTEGRPFLVVTISSEANLARLEEIRRANLRLWDPRGLGDDEAARLIDGGRSVVALHFGIHATEVGCTLAALELADRLARDDDPDVRAILDAAVIVMLPSHNPDGAQKVAEWYRATLGRPWEGASPPFLYQLYTGHDNNRDWYMFTQAESLLTVRHVYDRWRPQIAVDVHQMGTHGARLFVPPYHDPWEPNVDPALQAAANALGAHVAARLTTAGKAGVVVDAIYDAWSPSRAYMHTHGGVRLLTETASARLATPLDVPFDRLEPGLGYDPRRASWNFPLPWPGGTWRLRDVVDYQLDSTLAVLEHAARQRDFWLRTFLAVNRRACERREPYAFAVPALQRDPLAAARLLEVLRTGAVELHRARAPFEAGGTRFDAGTHVVLMAQPAGGFAKTVLERQQYPDLRAAPGAPPQRPYDATAHTLPLLMGVDVRVLAAPFTAELEPAGEARVVAGRLHGRGAWLALGHTTGELAALGRLLRAGVSVRWALDGFDAGGRHFEPGALVVPASARARLEPLARELGFDAHSLAAPPRRALRLRAPRVGLYQSWVPAMDEGWTRFVFEREMHVAYQTLHDADVRAGELERRFDAIVLPDQSGALLLGGHEAGKMPPEYAGGLGEEGLAALRAFVQAGGTLIALNQASELPLQHFGLQVRNALADLKDDGPAPFSCPGSILRAQVECASPLAHGLEATSSVWFENSPAFDVAERGAQVVLRYTEPEPLLSGYLLGGRHLLGRVALVELPLGRGRVVLYGFRPQYRAQAWATYVTLLNAVYLSAASEEP